MPPIKKDELLSYRMEQLEERVDKLTGTIENARNWIIASAATTALSLLKMAAGMAIPALFK